MVYSKEFKVFKRWNRIGAVSLVCAVASVFAGKWMKSLNGVGDLIALVPGALFAYSFMRVVLFRCPRCGKLFSLTLGYRKSTGRNCAHCNLAAER